MNRCTGTVRIESNDGGQQIHLSIDRRRLHLFKASILKRRQVSRTHLLKWQVQPLKRRACLAARLHRLRILAPVCRLLEGLPRSDEFAPAVLHHALQALDLDVLPFVIHALLEDISLDQLCRGGAARRRGIDGRAAQLIGTGGRVEGFGRFMRTKSFNGPRAISATS